MKLTTEQPFVDLSKMNDLDKCCPSEKALMQSNQVNEVTNEHEPTNGDDIDHGPCDLHQKEKCGHQYSARNANRRIYHNQRYHYNQFQHKSKSFKVYELDGQYKFNLKNSYRMYRNPVQCPSCVVTNLAQTYRHKGIPWCNRNVDYRFEYPDIYCGLHAELTDFYNYMKPMAEDDILRKATFYSISKSIKRLDFIDSVKYYGSYSSNTYLPVSDIDLCVFFRTPLDSLNALCTIARQLFNDGLIDNTCQVLPHCRIPLLKFYDSVTGLPINITINTENILDRSQYIRDHIKPNSYLIKILYFLKFYLLHKGFNQVFHGGIGSYALSLLVIRYFQEPETQELIMQCENGQNKSVLGHLLAGFLKRFSDIDFVRTHKISLDDNGCYKKRNPEDAKPIVVGKKESVLFIEDPFNNRRNVCNGSYNSDHILSDFGHLYQKLFKSVKKDRKGRKSILAREMVVVDSFVDYRRILRDIYRDWFNPIFKKYGSRSRFGLDLFGEFIQKRNIYGNRFFDCKLKWFDNGIYDFMLEPIGSSSQINEPESRGISPDFNSSDFYSSRSVASSSSSSTNGAICSNKHFDYDCPSGCELSSASANEMRYSKRFHDTMAVNCYNSPKKNPAYSTPQHRNDRLYHTPKKQQANQAKRDSVEYARYNKAPSPYNYRDITLNEPHCNPSNVNTPRRNRSGKRHHDNRTHQERNLSQQHLNVNQYCTPKSSHTTTGSRPTEVNGQPKTATTTEEAFQNDSQSTEMEQFLVDSNSKTIQVKKMLNMNTNSNL